MITDYHNIVGLPIESNKFLITAINKIKQLGMRIISIQEFNVNCYKDYIIEIRYKIEASTLNGNKITTYTTVNIKEVITSES